MTYPVDRATDRDGDEDQPLGEKGPATRRKDIDEGPGRPLVTQDIPSVQTGHIEVAVWPEGEGIRCTQPAAPRGHEGVDEGPGRPVIALDRIRMEPTGVEMTVRSKD